MIEFKESKKEVKKGPKDKKKQRSFLRKELKVKLIKKSDCFNLNRNFFADVNLNLYKSNKNCFCDLILRGDKYRTLKSGSCFFNEHQHA